VTARVMLPADTTPGQYRIFAAANDDVVFTEAETGNNALGTARPIKVGPDLVATTATATPRVTGPGSVVQVRHTIKNRGGVPAGPFDVGLYLSRDTVLGGDDVLLRARRVTGLAMGALSAATTTVRMPGNVVAGTYFILVRADDTAGAPGEVAEAHEANNVLATAGIQVVRPDLKIVSVTAPAAAAPGEKVSVGYTVKNLALPPGVAPASTTRVYLSADAVLDVPGDAVVGEAPVRALTGGAQMTVRKVVAIPAETAPGRYWLLAQANATNTVPEADAPGLTNNVKATATPILIGADLVVTAATATPRATAPGSKVAVRHTVRNRGGEVASPFDVGLYLSTDTVPGGDDVLLTTRRLAGLAVGALSAATTTVRIPGNVVAGTYFILVRADVGGEVLEAHEGNNLRRTGALQTIQADLAVRVVTAPAVAAPGASVRVRHVVRNEAPAAGKAAASTTRVYLSADAGLDVPGDVVVGEMPVGALTGGAQAMVRKVVTIPAETAPGRYWLIAQANATNTMPEADAPGLANNVKATTIPILVGPDLVVTALTTTTKLASPNFTFPVTTTVRNRGSSSATTSAIKFYLNTAPTLGGSPIPAGVSATAPPRTRASRRRPVDRTRQHGGRRLLADADGNSPTVAEANDTGSVLVRNTGPGPSAPFTVKGVR